MLWEGVRSPHAEFSAYFSIHYKTQADAALCLNFLMDLPDSYFKHLELGFKGRREEPYISPGMLQKCWPSTHTS